MAKISGILTDGAGQIINDCTIELYAKKTTNNVLTQTQAFTVATDGRYSINAQPCEYDVSLIINGFPKKRIGTINVYSDSADGSLNDYLINPDMSDLTPEFLKQVFDARSEAKNAANASSQSATNSATSATEAKASEINAKSFADEAKESADNADNNAQIAVKSSTTATDAASVATASSDTAKSYADKARDSANASSQSASAASQSEQNSKTSETNAKSFADEAKISADNAKSLASTVDHSNFVKKTRADSQSIDGELIVGTLSANEKINASEILENGNRVYSPNNKPDADTVGALPVVKIADNEISTYSVDDNVDFKKIPTVGGKSVITDLTDVDNKIELIKTKTGDFRLMPFRANELPFGWYFRNGDNYLLNSPQGQVLNQLSDNYKRDHQITIKTINGRQYINVPSAFSPDGRGFFERAVNGTTRQVGTVEGDSMRQLSGCFLGFNETGNNIDNMFYADERYIFDASGSQQNRALNLAWNVFDNNRVNNPVSNENRPLNIGLTPAIYLGV